jgi:hypothetical protein
MSRFERPHNNKESQDMFGLREVGLNHPDVDGFIRIRDNGDIEIVVGEGCGIILNAKKRSVTIVADEVKFITNAGNAIRWNEKRFNYQGNSFTQPALVDVETSEHQNLYDGAADFYGGET